MKRLTKKVNPQIYAGLPEDLQMLAKYGYSERAENINLLLAAVGVAFGVSKSEIVGTCRKAYIVDARVAYAHLLRNVKKMTFQDIGAILGKDHSTIIHYVDKHKELMEFDAKYRSKFDVLTKIICRI